jgi:hypothetical protein
MTVSNICWRESAQTVNAITKQLTIEIIVNFASDGWTSKNNLAVSLGIAYYIRQNWAWREDQLTFGEVHWLLCSRFESQLRMTGQ